MSALLEKWEEYKEAMGAEEALQSLELAIGTWALEENAEYIMRVADFHNVDDEEGED